MSWRAFGAFGAFGAVVIGGFSAASAQEPPARPTEAGKSVTEEAVSDPSALVLLVRSSFDVMRRCWPDMPARAEFGWHVHQIERRSASLLAALPLDQLRESARNVAVSEPCDEDTREALKEVPVFAAKFARDLGAEAYSEEESWRPDVSTVAVLLAAHRAQMRCAQAPSDAGGRVAAATRAMRRMLDEYAGPAAAAALWSAAVKTAADDNPECTAVSGMIGAAVDLANERISP